MTASDKKPMDIRSTAAVFALTAVHVLLVFLPRILPSHKGVFTFFFFSLVILPGYLAASILFPRARIHYTALFSLVLGTAQVFIVLLIFSVFEFDIFYVSLLIPALTISLAVYRLKRSFSGFDIPRNAPLPPTVIAVLIAVAVLVSVLTLGIGDALYYTGDAQDNMAYIRAIARSHQAFPDRFIYPDGGTLTRDIRRGLMHSVWGTASLLTGRRDVLAIWPIISCIGSLSLLLAVFCLGIQLFDDQRIALLGVLLYVFFFQRGLAGHHLITAAYGFHLGKIYLYAFMIFALRHIRTNGPESLLMAAAASLGAIGTHVSYAMIIPFFVFILIIAELLGRKGGDAARRTGRAVPLLAGALLLINLPYLILRYVRDFHPANEIHTHVHGMLFLTDDLAVLNPFLLYEADGVLMAVSFVAVFLLWPKSRSAGNLRFLLLLTAGLFVLLFNPLWVPFVMDKITYLIVRFSTAVPTACIAAYLIHSLWRRLRGRSRYPSSGAAIIGILIVAALLVPALVDTFTDFAYGGARRRMRDESSAKNLADLYHVLNEEIPEGSTIAADPLTSYCILAFTDHYVVCTFDQHSTPNDSTALDRIKAVRNVYLPFSSCREIAETLDSFGADYIVVNGRIPRHVRSEYWKPDRENAAAAAYKLSRCGNSFELIYSNDSVHLFRYLSGERKLSEIPSEGSTPLRMPQAEQFSGTYTDLTPSGVEGIYLHDWGKALDSVSRGDTIRLFVEWVAMREMEFSSYVMYVRFDTDYEKGPLYDPRFGKLYRKAVEYIRGERYRFRIAKLPFEGIYPPDLWPAGVILREYFDVPVPKDIAPGTYIISFKLADAPHVSNLRMQDLLSDDDLYDGPDLMGVTIE